MSPSANNHLRLSDIALAAVAARCGGACQSDSPEMRRLAEAAGRVNRLGSPDAALRSALAAPGTSDDNLLRLHAEMSLSAAELLTIALAVAVDEDPVAGRVLAHVQAPVGGSRPTLGLIAESFREIPACADSVLAAILNGSAAASGLLVLGDDSAPVPERTAAVPVPLSLALAGRDSRMPGTAIGLDGANAVPLPPSILAEAKRHAAALRADGHRSLVLRSGSRSEARSVALAVAQALGMRPAFVETDRVAGLGPWLLLRGLIPVFCFDLAPGERVRLPGLPGYRGPLLALLGLEGAVEPPDGSSANWVLPVPGREERRLLWQSALERNAKINGTKTARAVRALSRRLAADYRHCAGRIAHVAGVASHYAAVRERQLPGRIDILDAHWTAEGGGLESLAQPVRVSVPDRALVAPPALRASLDDLILRCRMREQLSQGLGLSAAARYRPGVRALLTGPSGTGKTLAANWIATRLGLPLYRVDLASVTSKYIGETEKNLSILLARAEHSEVILLFDEADSLFGKRTDVNDANDRFANAQTNYLLQRIESYDGIVVLTSNSRSRFDPSFTRRLDFLIDFPSPGPAERRALWEAHLGQRTQISETELNRIAVLVDFTGGHIRNAVLAAAVRANDARRTVQFPDVLYGVESELRKLGRQVPVELRMAS
jgi:hypothetical protein